MIQALRGDGRHSVSALQALAHRSAMMATEVLNERDVELVHPCRSSSLAVDRLATIPT